LWKDWVILMGVGCGGLELSQVEFRAPRVAICRASRGTYEYAWTDVRRWESVGQILFNLFMKLTHSFLPSFQLLAYPIEPVAIVLKMEAVYSSGVSEQACTTWFETPKNNHNLNHRHVKFVFLRNYCHVCECHNSESKCLLVQAVMKAHVGASVSVAALIVNRSTRWRWVVIVMDCHGLVTFLHGKTPLVAIDWEGGKVLLPVWMLWRREESLPPASNLTVVQPVA